MNFMNYIVWVPCTCVATASFCIVRSTLEDVSKGESGCLFACTFYEGGGRFAVGADQHASPALNEPIRKFFADRSVTSLTRDCTTTWITLPPSFLYLR